MLTDSKSILAEIKEADIESNRSDSDHDEDELKNGVNLHFSFANI